MANYCPNCGSSVNSNAAFCQSCGAQLNNSSYTNQQNTYSNNSNRSNIGNIVGRLVTVSLLGGITRQLYYYRGRYFLDPHCRNPFVGPRIISHRPIGMMKPRMGGMPHNGPGMHGGFRGGGPRGGHHR